jgi:hypothetical protein
MFLTASFCLSVAGDSLVNSFASLSGCRFINCTAQHDGGITYVNNAQLTVDTSMAQHCMSLNGTAGAFATDAGSMELVRTTLTQNAAHGDGGAVSCIAHSACYLQTCTLDRNVATGNGGAVLVRDSSMQVIETTLQNNWASMGGAIHCNNSNMDLMASFVTSNAANNGGALVCREVIEMSEL